MKLARIASVIVLALFVFAACDDDDPSGPVIADLAGFWNATQFQYDDATGDFPGFGIDAIVDGGGTITLDVEESGAFSGTLSIPDLTVDPQTGETITIPIGGTISLIDDNTLSIDFNAATEQLGFFGDFDASYTLTGDVLTFVNDDTSFDFPDDTEQLILGTTRGIVAVTLTARFERQ